MLTLCRVVVLVLLLSVGMVQAQPEERVLLADFQEELFLGKDSDGLDIGFVAWGDSAGNVQLALVEATDMLERSEQEERNRVLQVTYDIRAYGGFTHAFTDGSEWIAQDWSAYSTLDFWLYGANSGGVVQVEIFDNRAPEARSDSAERWYFRLVDEFEGWQFFSIPFTAFQRRTDWQPSGAPSDGLGLVAVHGYAFSFQAGVGSQVNYIDDVALSVGEGNVMTMDDTGNTVTTASEAENPLVLPEYQADGEWILVWQDEFDLEAGSAINPAYWTCEVGGHGWGNAQLEHNTNRLENVAHDGESNLVITARKETYRGNEYTSARCNTAGKVEFTYGRVEARIKLPQGQGIWPAFWMLGADFPEVGWPQSGEIDIMEYIGSEPRSVHGTVHGPGFSGSGGLGMRYIFDQPIAESFHIFGIEWEPNIIRWTFDGEVFHTTTPETLYGGTWVFDHNFFMLLNVAVGGNWPKNPDKTTVFPQEMKVDWVRVYQKRTD